VARVTSAGAIELSGSPVPAPAVASLPRVVGDQITTSNFAALVMFRDRSRLTVAPNSSVKVEGGAASIRLRIAKGGAALYPSNGSAIRLVNQAVSSQSLMRGVLPLCQPPPPRSPICPHEHWDPNNHDYRVNK
jgi:hypothetical protein